MGKIIGLILIVGIAFAGYFFFQNEKPTTTKTEKNGMSQEKSSTEISESVKEFSTTAYYDETGVWFSLKEMRVKAGDTIHIKATNTKGMHDFVIDEFGVKKELPLNEEVVIEFTANKTGEFVFYCSKPGHRAKGQWGTLIVE
ncbi:MAG: cupredoxin domain-containing protein [Candidatus Moranbacteria bacterium]|jgi:heme/copper-type cytochrome/quinol oxidase subunit 2|nr:cupredoxin domain-containing protein [Candidatus Moranbacteria bacterium]MBP9801359.1 cupredoxin domain-containing protein [Candidatus Moranbacteria bacterium]